MRFTFLDVSEVNVMITEALSQHDSLPAPDAGDIPDLQDQELTLRPPLAEGVPEGYQVLGCRYLGAELRVGDLHIVRKEAVEIAREHAAIHNIDLMSVKFFVGELVMNAASFSSKRGPGGTIERTSARRATLLIIGYNALGIVIGVGDTESGWSRTPDRAGTIDPAPGQVTDGMSVSRPREAPEDEDSDSLDLVGEDGRGINIMGELAAEMSWSPARDGKFVWAVINDRLPEEADITAKAT